MSTKIDEGKRRINELVREGDWLCISMQYEVTDSEGKKEIRRQIESLGKNESDLYQFAFRYESWYSEALLAVKLLLPDRMVDFVQLYKNDKRKEIKPSNYSIADAVLGITGTRGLDILYSRATALPRVRQQVSILKGAEKVLESALSNLEFTLQAELFDSEMDAALGLLDSGFIRAAGAVCGVVLEKHLSKVCDEHKISISKKKPTINDYNEALRKEDVIDLPTWRHIQMLGDYRNLCDHDKKKEPTKEQVSDLHSGTIKIIKTVF